MINLHFSIHFSLLLDSDGHIAVTDFGLSKENLEDDKVIVNSPMLKY